MRTLQLTLSTADGTLNAADAALAATEGVVRNAILGLDWRPDGDSVLLYRVESPSNERVETVLAEESDVHEYDVTHEDEGAYSVFVHTAPAEPLASLFELVERNGLLIDRPITFANEGIAVRIVGTESALQSAMAEIPETVDIHLENTSEHAPGEQTLRTQLTERQQEAIEAALELGYYETPREVTYEEIAAALDCAPSTANELLRRAEGKLVSAVFAENGGE